MANQIIPLQWEKPLRKSAVNTLDKVNELIDFINNSSIHELNLVDSDQGREIITGTSTQLAQLEIFGESVQNGTPTPDNQIPVKVVSGINLAKPYSFNSSVSGVTLEYENNGSISINGSATADIYAPTAGTAVTQGLTYILQPGIYTMSFKGNIGTLNANVTSSVGNIIASVTENSPTATFTLTEPTEVFHRVNVPNGVTINTTLAIQIEVGTTPHTYIPYGYIGLKVHEAITQINLNGHDLASLPDGTQDILHVNSAGKVWIEQHVGKIILDGSETWNLNTAVGVGFAFTPLLNVNSENQINLLCDRFFAQIAATIGGNVYVSGDNVLFFRTTGFEPENSTEAKTWFTNNPTKVYYQLATPQTVDLGTITPPKITSGSTAEIVATLQPEFLLTWFTEQGLPIVVNDLKAYIDYII